MGKMSSSINLDAVRAIVRGEPIEKIKVYMTDKTDVLASISEGEIVEIDGKEWTRKNGIVQSISKWDEIRKPLFCPECKKIMDGKLDDKMWNLHGKCFACVLLEEHKLKVSGQFKSYEEKKLRENEIAFLKEGKVQVTEYLNNLKDQITYVNPNGTLEKWTNENKAEMQKFLENELIEINKRLVELGVECENINV